MLEVVVRDGQMMARGDGSYWTIFHSGCLVYNWPGPVWVVYNWPAKASIGPFVLVDENDPIVRVPGTGVESPHWGTLVHVALEKRLTEGDEP